MTVNLLSPDSWETCKDVHEIQEADKKKVREIYAHIIADFEDLVYGRFFTNKTKRKYNEQEDQSEQADR